MFSLHHFLQKVLHTLSILPNWTCPSVSGWARAPVSVIALGRPGMGPSWVREARAAFKAGCCRCLAFPREPVKLWTESGVMGWLPSPLESFWTNKGPGNQGSQSHCSPRKAHTFIFILYFIF